MSKAWQSMAKRRNVFIRIFATQARDSLLCSVMKCNKYPFIASIFVWIGYLMALASSQLNIFGFSINRSTCWQIKWDVGMFECSVHESNRAILYNLTVRWCAIYSYYQQFNININSYSIHEVLVPKDSRFQKEIQLKRCILQLAHVY